MHAGAVGDHEVPWVFECASWEVPWCMARGMLDVVVREAAGSDDSS